MYPIAPDLMAAVQSLPDPMRAVVVEESPEWPGELVFQTLTDSQVFLEQYKDWVSRFLCLNELFMLRDFVTTLEADGWTVIFGESTRTILENYQAWEQPLDVKGFTCPGDGSLYPYQTFTLQRALQRAENPIPTDRLMFAGWCAGAGKSLFACAGTQELFNRDRIDVALVFTMMKLKTNMLRFYQDTTSLDAAQPDGAKAQRQKTYTAGHQVLILNYEKLWVDYEELKALTEGRRVLWIFDETQKVLTDGQNPPTKTRRHLDRLVTKSLPTVWPMSASVVNHSPLRYRDVFNLAGGKDNPLGSYPNFEQRYAYRIRRVPIGYSSEIKYYEWNIPKLHEVRHRVASRTQSVRKTDPGVRDFFKGMQTILTPVQMSPEDHRLYKAVEKMAKAAKKAEEPLMPYYQALRYICNTPESLAASANPVCQQVAAEHPHLINSRNCSKMEMFLDQIEEIAEQGDKCVAFSKWTRMGILLLAPHLRERKINFVLHYGVGQTNTESQEAQHRFKTDPDVTLFLSSDAGALGLNLPEARFVLNYECPYSFDLLMQRNERVNRADSKLEGYTSYVYVTDGTVERRIWATCNERRELAAATLGTSEVLSHGHSDRSESANLEYLLFG